MSLANCNAPADIDFISAVTLEATKFWNAEFGSNEHVTFELLMHKLVGPTEFQAVSHYFNKKATDTANVTDLTNLLLWFGPTINNLIVDISTTINKPWFFGTIGHTTGNQKQIIKKRLNDLPKGLIYFYPFFCRCFSSSVQFGNHRASDVFTIYN